MQAPSTTVTDDRLTIRVYFDYASTLCYVAHRILADCDREIEALGLLLEWQPIDLTVGAPWDRGDSFRPEVREAVHNTARELGIEVEMPDPWIDSRAVSELTLRAPSREDATRFRHAVFDSIFVLRQANPIESVRDVAGPWVAEDEPLLSSVGSAPAAPTHEQESDERDDEVQPSSSLFPKLDEVTSEAFALGVTGVPTFLLDHWAFGGVHARDEMVALLAQLAEQYRELGSSVVN